MRIIDERGNRVDSPDLDGGRLVREERPIFHRYEVVREEEGHHEVVAEYPNGGKDVEWVVDVPEEGRWVAYDADGAEVETDAVIPDDAPHEMEIPDVDSFYRYVLLTAEELAERARAKAQAEIGELKGNLASTDYVAAKAMDALLSCSSIADLLSALASVRSDYADVLEKRREWREKINALKSEPRG